MGNFHSWSKELISYHILFHTKFFYFTLQFCAIDSRFLHKTVLKLCLKQAMQKQTREFSENPAGKSSNFLKSEEKSH